jgi:protein subunit release factor B
MALPTQIEKRLKALGVRAADVEEKLVRGAGPGGQKIKRFKRIPAVSRGSPN